MSQARKDRPVPKGFRVHKDHPVLQVQLGRRVRLVFKDLRASSALKDRRDSLEPLVHKEQPAYKGRPVKLDSKEFKDRLVLPARRVPQVLRVPKVPRDLLDSPELQAHRVQLVFRVQLVKPDHRAYRGPLALPGSLVPRVHRVLPACRDRLVTRVLRVLKDHPASRE